VTPVDVRMTLIIAIPDRCGATCVERLLRYNPSNVLNFAEGSVANRRAERQQSFDGAWVARTVSSVVVVFELVAYGDDGNSRLVFNFEQRDVA
jgi:hypothetical protein